jgi:hypothetical protein
MAILTGKSRGFCVLLRFDAAAIVKEFYHVESAMLCCSLNSGPATDNSTGHICIGMPQ